jgi:hypothetical protein
MARSSRSLSRRAVHGVGQRAAAGLHAANAAPSGGLQDGGARSVAARDSRASAACSSSAKSRLSCALVVCVGTLVRGISALEHFDLGIDTDHLLTARVLLPAGAFPTGGRAVAAVRPHRRTVAQRSRASSMPVSARRCRARTTTGRAMSCLPAPVPRGNCRRPRSRQSTTTFLGHSASSFRKAASSTVATRPTGVRVAVADRTFAERYGDGHSIVGRQFRLDPRGAEDTTVTIVA